MSESTASETGGHVRRSFGERLWGALKLDASVYEEVEHDPDALGQAAIVVGLGALAQALVFAVLGGGVALVLPVFVQAFLGWVVMTGLVWLIGVRFLDHTSDFPELLRTLGFASAPFLLTVAALVIPVYGFFWLVSIAVTVLVAIAFVIAARQALDIETGRAVAICIGAVLARWLLAALLAPLFA